MACKRYLVSRQTPGGGARGADRRTNVFGEPQFDGLILSAEVRESHWLRSRFTAWCKVHAQKGLGSIPRKAICIRSSVGRAPEKSSDSENQEVAAFKSRRMLHDVRRRLRMARPARRPRLGILLVSGGRQRAISPRVVFRWRLAHENLSFTSSPHQ